MIPIVAGSPRQNLLLAAPVAADYERLLRRARDDTGAIANMLLGVRHEGVTEGAGHLRRDGLIHYSRGHITVLAPPKLQARVCGCYTVIKRETVRLLPQQLATH